MRLVIQRKTKKRYKVLQLMGVAALLFGVAWRTGTGELAGTVVALLGLLFFILGRVAAWWHHG
jgi:hypothetical protein